MDIDRLVLQQLRVEIQGIIERLDLLLGREDLDQEMDKDKEEEIEHGVYYVKPTEWCRGYTSTKGAQRKGYCFHSYGNYYCRHQAKTSAGYCLRHDPTIRQEQAERRKHIWCAGLKKNGERCLELHMPGSSFCRHHTGATP